MTGEEFIEKHCKICGVECCHGVYSKWFDNCYYKNELDGYIDKNLKHLTKDYVYIDEKVEEIDRIYNEYLKNISSLHTYPADPAITTTGTGDSQNINYTYTYGWICPRCGKVHAPDVKECTCKPEPKSNVNNPFYQTIEDGYCSTGPKYTSCPEKPNHNSCQHCMSWVKCIPV